MKTASRLLILLAGLSAALLLAPGAAQAVTATSPIADAATTSHPVLAWSLAPGETTGSVTISDNPARTPDGSFFDEHVVDFAAPVDTATSWSPTAALFSGRYWWSVQTYDAASNSVRTSPASFVVEPTLTRARWGWTRYPYLHEMDFAARWTTNAESVVVTFKVTRNGKTLFKRSRREPTYVALTETTSNTLSWHNHRVKRGRRVRVSVTLSISGHRVAQSSRLTKAP
jgi:hypothetical protein